MLKKRHSSPPKVLILLSAFIASLLCTLVIVRAARAYVHRSVDHDFSKPQGFHAVAVPRIGGAGIVAGLLGAAGVLLATGRPDAAFPLLWLLACAAPAFLAGFVQDFTEAVTPRGRLVATCVSAGMAFLLMDTGIRRTDIPGLDWVAGFALGSLVLTTFAVAGIANAVNIIDGFNGLASMCVALMLAAMAYVAFQVDDALVGMLALVGVGAVLGFFVWNFPAGLIFLGDGGAYFLGFYLAEVGLLLIARNPQVSPLFPLLVCIYPVFETVFSMYRRLVLRQRAAHMPDGIHLHSLIFRRLVRWAAGGEDPRTLTRKNSRTAPYLWVLCTFSLLPALLFWDSTPVLSGGLLLFAVSYTALYWQIVRFRTPSWLAAAPRRHRGRRRSSRTGR